MPLSFVRKSIVVEIILESGDFGGEGNTKTIEGLPCEVTIQKPGLPEKNSASIKISGLPYEDLVNLTSLSFLPMESQKNLISVKAGDEGGEMALAFAGEISSAWADFNQSPDVALQIEAESGFYPQRISAPPMSINGEAPAATLIAQQAHEMGYSFQNRGVTASVRNAIFSGSPMEKTEAIAQQVGADLIVDDNEIILLPEGGHRGGEVPLLSANSGLAGYPTFNQDGIVCKCLYRKDLELGGLIKVESIVPRATGTWKITKLSHSLAAYQSDDGPWFSEIEGEYVG